MIFYFNLNQHTQKETELLEEIWLHKHQAEFFGQTLLIVNYLYSSKIYFIHQKKQLVISHALLIVKQIYLLPKSIRV